MAIGCLRTEQQQKLGDQHVSVLDIGTGSGLLALLAHRHGADTIMAVEWVPELARAAMANFALAGASNWFQSKCTQNVLTDSSHFARD